MFNRRTFLTSMAGFAAVTLAPKLAFAMGKSGSFKSHKAYRVKGNASVDGNKIRLSGFRTSNGPDLYVYVGNGSASKQVAKLKSKSGNQSYTLPNSIKAGSFTTVHIHCKAFNSTFATAKLN